MSILKIYDDNYPEFLKFVNKINKSAKKYNNTEFKFQEINTYKKEIKYNNISIIRLVHIIKIDDLNYNNWEIIAKIEHTKKGNIIIKLENIELPEKYITIDGNCDHCNYKHKRKYTTILYNKNEKKYLQIGNTCLKDFLGYDPVYLDLIFNIRNKYNESIKENDLYNNFSNGKFELNCIEYLSWVNLVIKKYGWVSRSKAKNRFDIISTSDSALIEMLKKEKKLYPTDDDIKESKLALEWVKNIKINKNEYLNNIKILASNETFNFKYAGFVASILNTYKNETKKINENKIESNWIGNIKEKVELNVMVNEIKLVESYYGITKLIKMTDDKNNIIIWWTKSNTKLIENINYKIKAIIKKHDLFNNIKQTIVTRVNII